MSKNYLGLDPSTKSTGFGVLDKDSNLLSHGTIEGRTDNPKSFIKLHDELKTIIEKHNVGYVLIEDTFFSQNVDTLKKLVRPSGIILYMVGLYELEHDFIMPSSWRKLAFGSGRTSKKETYAKINEEYDLGYTSFNKYNDITDAIGIAKACVQTFG